MSLTLRDAQEPRHACSFHHSRQEQIALGLPFIQRGLERGDRCIVISDDAAAWATALQTPEATEARDLGALSLWTSDQWLTPGNLNSLRMARHAWDVIEEALRDFAGLHLVVDMDWTFTTDAAASDVCHAEATLDHLCEGDHPVHILCQYDYSRLPAALLHAGLRTHASILVGERVLPNLYDEAPAILDCEPDLNECSSDAAFVRGLLMQFVPSA